MSPCAERVDAGHEGILVNLYGDDKGVGEVSMCTGMVWYNPFTESVYEYPTYVQTVDYEPFTINAKDGSEFTVDPTVSLKIRYPHYLRISRNDNCVGNRTYLEFLGALAP